MSARGRVRKGMSSEREFRLRCEHCGQVFEYRSVSVRDIAGLFNAKGLDRKAKILGIL